jgi:GDP-4-dehydro-6-deoxy-D-mannose reductase
VSGPVLVTGAAGFAGSHLLECLSDRGRLVAWTRSSVPKGLETLAAWDRIDLLERDRVRAAIRDLRPSAVFHCAGSPHVALSWQDTARPLTSNVLTTHYLLDALRRAGARSRVLIPGSATVYAPSASPLREDSALAPQSPYALSKLAQEELGLRALKEDGVDVIVARSFNHTGPRQSADFFVPGVARQIASIERGTLEPVIKVGNLDAERDLTDVRDTVRAYALLLEKGAPGTIYNVASGMGRRMRDVLDGLLQRARVPVRVEIDPARLRPRDIPALVGDATRLRSATGWSPVITFDRMLDELLDYWRAGDPVRLHR